MLLTVRRKANRFRSKKIEVGPPAAKRHVGKQKPQVVDDSQSGSSRKKVVVSYPKLDEEDELDKVAGFVMSLVGDP